MSELVSPELAEAIVDRALANGGEFAELYAERSRGMSMSIDESRIERVGSGSEHGAGVRVVRDGTAYFAHVDGLGEGDLQRAADEAAAALRGERSEPVPLQALQTKPQEIRVRPGGGPGGAQGRAACASSTIAAAPRATRSTSFRFPTARSAARSRSRTRPGPTRPTIAPGCGSAPRQWRAATARWRPGSRPWPATVASSCSTATLAGSPSRRPARRSTCSMPSPRPPARCRWSSAAASVACSFTR